MPRGKNAGNKGQGSKWLTKKKRLAIYARDGNQCVWCGAFMTELTIDHVIPRSRGGCNHPANLVTACMGCNRQRGDLPVGVFLSSYFTLTLYSSILLRLAAAIDASHNVPGFKRPRVTKAKP